MSKTDGRQYNYMGYSYQASAQSAESPRGTIWSASVTIGELYAGKLGLKRFPVDGTFRNSSDAIRASESWGKRIIDREIPGIEQLWPNGRPKIDLY